MVRAPGVQGASRRSAPFPSQSAEEEPTAIASSLEVASRPATENAFLITVRGEVDIATVPVLTREIAEVVGRKPARLIIDLTESPFMSAAGVAVLFDADRKLRERGGRLVVACASTHVRKLLTLTGLSARASVVSSREEAVRA